MDGNFMFYWNTFCWWMDYKVMQQCFIVLPVHVFSSGCTVGRQSLFSIIWKINGVEATASTPKVLTKNDQQVSHCVNILINKFEHSVSQKMIRNLDMVTVRQKQQIGIYRCVFMLWIIYRDSEQRMKRQLLCSKSVWDISCDHLEPSDNCIDNWNLCRLVGFILPDTV